jgi:hypothetical protein
MLVVFIVGVGLAGLSIGGWIASITILFLMMSVTALTIAAFVGHGELRCFAIGFVISWIAYVVPHALVGSSELDPHGKLATTQLWLPVYERLVRREFVDIQTGKVIPNYDPANPPKRSQGLGGMGGMGGMGMGGMGGSPVSMKESLDRAEFMMLAHALFAAAFAYAGGKFAVWIDSRSAGSANRKEQAKERKPG